jgi:AMMECR1 domain-containing protein
VRGELRRIKIEISILRGPDVFVRKRLRPDERQQAIAGISAET